jgi:hypothetical protein
MNGERDCKAVVLNSETFRPEERGLPGSEPPNCKTVGGIKSEVQNLEYQREIDHESCG